MYLVVSIKYVPMTYKAISLKQPWANLVISGKKTIETRKWTTKYRGDLVICSSANPKIEPYGKALGIVELVGVEKMNEGHEKAACIKVYPRAFAWHLRNIRKFEKPISVKGKLGIFDVELELI